MPSPKHRRPHRRNRARQPDQTAAASSPTQAAERNTLRRQRKALRHRRRPSRSAQKTNPRSTEIRHRTDAGTRELSTKP
jgi:hypothetical protein